MRQSNARLQSVLYRVFLVSCVAASVLGLATIWGLTPSAFLARLLGTFIVIAVASAFTMSATRLVGGRPAEDDGG